MKGQVGGKIREEGKPWEEEVEQEETGKDRREKVRERKDMRGEVAGKIERKGNHGRKR